MADVKRNLHQRILDAIKDIGSIKPTDKDRFGNAAIGIDATENGIRDALTRHGIVTRWSGNRVEDLGGGKLWLNWLTVTVINADNPEDRFEDTWADIGSSPTAATSFAVKDYYRRLLHIVDASDAANDARDVSVEQPAATRRSEPAPNAPAANSNGNSEYEAATPAQRSAIEKLRKLLGKSEDIGDLSKDEASAAITALSAEFNARKHGAAKEARP